MKPHYPNSWYVERADEAGYWRPLIDSAGNKSYATGYLNALESFNPHPAYRLITNKGKLSEGRHARSSVNVVAIVAAAKEAGK